MGADQTHLLHGTCVAIEGAAALLRGPSGAGKSDLALRFLSSFQAQGAVLVADDQVRIAAVAGRLMASPPPTIAGRMEVRGIGIVSVPHCDEAELRLLVDLCSSGDVPRLPPEPPRQESLLKIALPCLFLAPFEASTPAKLKLALTGRW